MSSSHHGWLATRGGNLTYLRPANFLSLPCVPAANTTSLPLDRGDIRRRGQSAPWPEQNLDCHGTQAPTYPPLILLSPHNESSCIRSASLNGPVLHSAEAPGLPPPPPSAPSTGINFKSERHRAKNCRLFVLMTPIRKQGKGANWLGWLPVSECVCGENQSPIFPSPCSLSPVWH